MAAGRGQDGGRLIDGDGIVMDFTTRCGGKIIQIASILIDLVEDDDMVLLVLDGIIFGLRN